MKTSRNPSKKKPKKRKFSILCGLMDRIPNEYTHKMNRVLLPYTKRNTCGELTLQEIANLALKNGTFKGIRLALKSVMDPDRHVQEVQDYMSNSFLSERTIGGFPTQRVLHVIETYTAAPKDIREAVYDRVRVMFPFAPPFWRKVLRPLSDLEQHAFLGWRGRHGGINIDIRRARYNLGLSWTREQYRRGEVENENVNTWL